MWTWLKTQSGEALRSYRVESSYSGFSATIDYLSGIIGWNAITASQSGGISSYGLTAKFEGTTESYSQDDAGSDVVFYGTTINAFTWSEKYRHVNSGLTEETAISSYVSYTLSGWYAAVFYSGTATGITSYDSGGTASASWLEFRSITCALEDNYATVEKALTRSGISWYWESTLVDDNLWLTRSKTTASSSTGASIPNVLTGLIDGPGSRATSTTATRTTTRIGADTTANPISTYASTITDTVTSSTELTSYTLGYTMVRYGSWRFFGTDTPPQYITCARANRGEILALDGNVTETSMLPLLKGSTTGVAKTDYTTLHAATITTVTLTCESISSQSATTKTVIQTSTVGSTNQYASGGFTYISTASPFGIQRTTVTLFDSFIYSYTTTATRSTLVSSSVNGESYETRMPIIILTTFALSVFTESNGIVSTATISQTRWQHSEVVSTAYRENLYGTEYSYTRYDYSCFDDYPRYGAIDGVNASVRCARAPGLMTGNGVGIMVDFAYAAGPFWLGGNRQLAIAPTNTTYTLARINTAIGSTVTSTFNQSVSSNSVSIDWQWTNSTSSTQSTNSTRTDSSYSYSATQTSSTTYSIRTESELAYGSTENMDGFSPTFGSYAPTWFCGHGAFGETTLLSAQAGKFTLRNSTGGTSTMRVSTNLETGHVSQFKLDSAIVALAFDPAPTLPRNTFGSNMPNCPIYSLSFATT